MRRAAAWPRPRGRPGPTSDRVREALFSSVGAALPLEGARVLDLFAGTGAVGLEAASRGAARVVLVESDRRALAVVRRNVATVALPGVEVVAAPVARFLDRQPAGRAVRCRLRRPAVSAGDTRLTGVLDAVLSGGWLAPGGFLRGRAIQPGAGTGRHGGRRPRRVHGTQLRRDRALVRSPAMKPRASGGSGRVRRALCPGSFDPVTNGHIDIIGRAASLYDEVVVAVFVNQSKSGLFSVDERRDMLGEVTAEFPNVSVDTFEGLVVDYCRAHDVPVIVKGLRAVSDFDYELQMAQMNRGLAGVDTLFMPTNPEYSFLASSLVKEIAKWGGDVSSLVPSTVLKRLMERSRSGG